MSAISGIKGDTLRRSQSDVMLTLNPTLTLFGFPLGLDLLVSTQESNLRQALNKFRMYFAPDQLARSLLAMPAFMLAIKGVEIGTCQPTYSALTLSGVPVTGAAVELAPWYVYLAGTGGRAQRGVEASDTSQPAFGRMLYAAKVGGGKKEGTHFYLTMLAARDDPGSIERPVRLDTTVFEGDTMVDTTELITPNENYLLGAEFHLNLAEGAFRLLSEVSAVEFTRDRRLPTLDVDGAKQVPGWAKGTVKKLNPNLSSSFDLAYAVKPVLSVFETNVEAELRMVGPGYRSLGAPSLRNDNMGYGLTVERGFLDRRVTLSASVRREHDNLVVARDSAGEPIRLKALTTSYTSYDFTLGLNFDRVPSLQVSFSPHREHNDSLDVSSGIVSFSTGYSFQTGQVVHSPGLSLALQDYGVRPGDGGYWSWDLGLSHDMSFSSPFVLGLGCGLSRTTYQDTTPTDGTFYVEASPGYTMFDRWNNAVTVGGSFERQGSRYDTRYSTGFPVWKICDGNASLGYSMYRGAPDPNDNNERDEHNEFRLTAGLSRSW
ncbi:hypothetical protein FJY69_06600 [candidate division WOR-3 bacterium]|nr:hypothetical protein [candidate division WOR-3 bacterium]